MTKQILRFCAIVAIVCGLVACKSADSAPKSEKFALTSLDNQKLEFTKSENLLSANHNKPYLLLFLSTWCDFCLGQAQHFENLHKDFGDKINIYGVFVDKDESVESLRDFANDAHTSFMWFYRGDIAALIDTYHIKTFPFILLYDKDGNLIMSYDGLTPEEMLAFDINKLL